MKAAALETGIMSDQRAGEAQQQQQRPRTPRQMESFVEQRFARYRKQAEELRAQIDRFNFEVPVRRLEKPGVWVAHELRRLSEPYERLRADLGWHEPLEVEPPGDDLARPPLVEVPEDP